MKLLLICAIVYLAVADEVWGKIVTGKSMNALIELDMKSNEKDSTNECAPPGEWGCYKGYCWAWCSAILHSLEWCWTTKGSTGDRRYVCCTEDSQCDPCWHCAGACSI